MNIKWETQDYADHFSFVHQYGESAMELIDKESGSWLVDLGCGNRAFSEKLKEKGYEVLGLDTSEDTIQAAKMRGDSTSSPGKEFCGSRTGIP